MERDQNSHDRLLNIFYYAPIAIALCDQLGRFIQVNPEFISMFGYMEEEVYNMTYLDLTLPDDHAASQVEMEQIYENQETHFQKEKRYKTKQGTIVWGRTVVSAINSGENRPLETFAMIQNISIAKLNRDLLQIKEKQYKDLVGLLFNGILIVDHKSESEKVVIDANLSASKMFGYTQVDEIVGKDSVSLLDDESIMKIDYIRNNNLFDQTHEMIGRTIEGLDLILDFQSKEIDFGTRKACLVAIRNKTEKVQAYQSLQKNQELLYHSQKMEAIGRLALGVAHDFNNLLAIISGYCDLILTQSIGKGGETLDSLVSDINEIQTAVEKGTLLTTQLLSLSKERRMAPQKLDLNNCIRRTVKMMTRVSRKKIVFSTHLDPSILAINFENSKFEQILLNLLVNAVDAIHETGSVDIYTKLVTISPDNPMVSSDPHIEIEVHDTGQGIPPEYQTRIFDPFFTTKSSSKGTGLGLSVVYSIITQYNGSIEVKSEVLKGTKFRITLPYIPYKTNTQ